MAASAALAANRALQDALTSILVHLEEVQERAEEQARRVRASLARAGSSEAAETPTTAGRRTWAHPSLFVAPDGSFPTPNAHALVLEPLAEKAPVAHALGKFSESETRALKRAVRQSVQESLTRKTLQELQSKRGLTMEQLDRKMDEVTNIDMASEDAQKACEEVNWEHVVRQVRAARTSGPVRTAEDCKFEWECFYNPTYNVNEWTESEDEKLLELAEKEQGTNWESIAQALGTQRRPADCLKRFQTKFNTMSSRKPWNLEEDKRLVEAVVLHGQNDWRAVAERVGTRSRNQCLHRWRRCSLKPGLKKGKWTKEEDEALRTAVNCIGPRYWSLIAQYVEGRSDTQCRERYVNVLSPARAVGLWSSREDALLKAAIRKYGVGKWSLISKEVPGRTDSQCRRHWLQWQSRTCGSRKGPSQAAKTLPPPKRSKR